MILERNMLKMIAKSGAYAIVCRYLRKTVRRINDTGYRDITKGRARTKMVESYLPDRQR